MKHKSDKLIGKFYYYLGKVVVFTGGFLGMFFLLTSFCSFVEPYVLGATTFCIENIKYILMGVFVASVLVFTIPRVGEMISDFRGGKFRK